MAFGRKTRRWLLFVITVITVSLVIAGTMFIGVLLEGNPVLFVAFWAVCFIGAMLVIVLALVDMRMIRQEHRGRQVELDAELARIVSDAEAMAESSQESGRE